MISVRKNSYIKHVVWYLFMILLGFIFLLPIIWMISSAFKTAEQIVIYPPEFIPRPFILRSFIEGFKEAPILSFTKNSIIVAVLCVIGNLFSSSLVGFGFARLGTRLKNFWFFILLSTMMIPGFVTMITTYVLYSKIGWINTFLPLVVPSFLGAPFYIFLMRQFFISIPSELMEAGKIDGVSIFGIYSRIFVPNTVPAMLVVLIFSFVNAWNDFFGPMIFLNSADKYTLAIGLTFFKQSYGATLDQGPLMAVSLFAASPIVILYLLAQKYFVQGIVTTGLK